jgi:hypothetical protein
MSKIASYDNSVLPNARLNTSANPYEFGAEKATALKELGNASMAMAEAQRNRGKGLESLSSDAATISNNLYKLNVEDEVTNVHTSMAGISANMQKTTSDMFNSTQPGDKTFVQRVANAADDQLKGLGDSLTTKEAQKTFAQMSASLKNQYIQQAINMQGRLEGDFAKNQATEISDNLSKVVSNNPNTLDQSIKQLHDFIDDPNGRFSRIDQASRDKYKYEATQKLNESATLGFIRQNPGALNTKIDPNVRNSLDKANENPPTPGMPPNLGADTVKPYDQGKIAYLVRKIDAPTKYDAWIQEAARKEGIDPRELKLRIGAESNFDPNAKSGQGAGGIMQFTPETAAHYGIDSTDPRDSIFGAAKVLADYQRKAGGDMSKVDMMYYGGESGKGWGPNTKQYAANLAAVRQQAGLATSTTPESFAPNSSELAANANGNKSIKTGFAAFDNLPADKQYAMLNHDRALKNAAEADVQQAQERANKAVKMQQEAVTNKLIARIYDPQNNGGPVTAVDIANMGDKLETNQITQLQNVLTHYNTQETRANKDHPEAYMSQIKDIYDPKNTTPTPTILNNLYNAMDKGEISAKEFMDLRDKAIKHRDGVDTDVRKNMLTSLQSAEKAFYQNPMLSGMEKMAPGTVREISQGFYRHMESKVAEYQKSGKDPAELFYNDKNPDYFYNPQLLRRFIPANPTSAAAAPIVTAEAQSMPTYNDYDKLKSGDKFTDPQGNIRTKK